MAQNKASINTLTSFNYLDKTNNNIRKINNNSINNNINNQRTKLNFNEICNYRMEINKLVEENIYLKSQIVDIKSKISQFENILERTDLKYQEQMNNYQKQLLKYNNYIHEVYLFLNNITNNVFPKLNFSIQKNESILINFDLFQSKLKLVEKYIYDLNKKVNNKPKIFDADKGYLLTDISLDKNNLEERVNFLEKRIMNRGLFKIPLKINKNKINNSVRSKYNYLGINEGNHFDDNICPRYHKIRQYNKVSNSRIGNERLKTSFTRSDENSIKKSFIKNGKNNNLTNFKKKSLINNKRSLTPLTKQKNVLNYV